MAMGTPGALSEGEIRKCTDALLTPRVMGRAWEYWARRLEKAEATWGDPSPTVRAAAHPKPERSWPAKLVSRLPIGRSKARAHKR
jgi:hypothetical protein